MRSWWRGPTGLLLLPCGVMVVACGWWLMAPSGEGVAPSADPSRDRPLLPRPASASPAESPAESPEPPEPDASALQAASALHGETRADSQPQIPDRFLHVLAAFLSHELSVDEIASRVRFADGEARLRRLWDDLDRRLRALRLRRLEVAEPILDDLIHRGLALPYRREDEFLELPGVMTFRRGRVAGSHREEYLVRIQDGSYPALDRASHALEEARRDATDRILRFLRSCNHGR